MQKQIRKEIQKPVIPNLRFKLKFLTELELFRLTDSNENLKKLSRSRLE